MSIKTCKAGCFQPKQPTTPTLRYPSPGPPRENYIPSIPKSMRVDKTLFDIVAHTEGQLVPTEITSTRLEDIAKVWYQHGTFSVHPGRFDNSGWPALITAFRGSIFQRMDTAQHLAIEDLQRCCSTSPNDYRVTTFIVKIVFLARNTFYMKDEASLVNIRLRLRELPVPEQQHEIYRMQYALEFEPTNMKNKRKCLLRLLCRQMKLKPLRVQYFLPVHYHHHLDMRKLHKCIRMLIDKLEIPRDIKSYIEWMTKVVRKKPMFSKNQSTSTLNSTLWLLMKRRGPTVRNAQGLMDYGPALRDK